ncbi:legumain [Paragonimus westermani]|uniref:Legumain n=1 Tax=Paragonimus westermani TaxID=34504 RepID=A0A5J4N8M4_9TREM|nr:legumain [Paragonimus westermani]
MPTVSTGSTVVICLVVLTQAWSLQSFISHSDPEKNWAVLVAGPNRWCSYPHQVGVLYSKPMLFTNQSDVCHAYQILIGLGIPKENIITFMYDDIVNNTENPYPGKIFNDYDHKDVYAGVQIDYKGSNVSSEMFVRVMKGDTRLKAAGRKVLESLQHPVYFIMNMSVTVQGTGAVEQRLSLVWTGQKDTCRSVGKSNYDILDDNKLPSLKLLAKMRSPGQRVRFLLGLRLTWIDPLSKRQRRSTLN